MTKLLNKPFKAFTVYALILLACSVPAYYYVIDKIWIREIDNQNEILKEKIENGLRQIKLNEIELIKTLQFVDTIHPGLKLIPIDSSGKRKILYYTISRKRENSNKIDRFRGLSAYLYSQKKYYLLTVETNVKEKKGTIITLVNISFFFFIFLVAGFIIINRIISIRIWQPFKNNLDKLNSFDLKTQKELNFKPSIILEFEELNQTLNKFIQKNISAYKLQKEFAENASHELQTPISVIKSKLDLLVQNSLLNQEQYELLTSINIPLSKLSRITKNLLLLAKIENRQYSNIETIGIKQVINETLSLLTDQWSHKNLKFNLELSYSLTCLANKNLFEILISNLLINAIKYTNEGYLLGVSVSASRIKVYNEGKMPLNGDQLFKRFASTSNLSGSSGLGLAIVKEICDLYSWEIRYEYENSQHIFSIEF